MIDAHCHLDFPVFDEDRDEIMARAAAAGVRGFIVAGVQQACWARQEALAKRYSNVRVALGIHPHVAARMSPQEIETSLMELDRRAEFAMGEMGLDGSRYCPRGSLPQQSEVFRAQLALARTHNLPVILHILAAHGSAYDILKRDGVPEAGGMVHSYSGSAEMVRNYQDLGLYISFSGSITRSTARRALKAVASVDEERLLVESDCPDQRPEGRKGSRNLPEWLTDVVAAVAAVRNTSREQVAETTAVNTCRLFGLKEWL
ncbi:MAG TPA: TatD family deoxyribonuclease [Myxococcales bacterium]|nr:TatD family deoxyribonuclease [Myxococcales bacterium]HIN86679.1 TatD family deoxyribonuclease [Myxococcales bacterium]